MATKKFKVDILSKSSVDNLIRDLRAYQNDLPNKARLLAQKLADKGVVGAKTRIAELNAVFTGELLSSVHSVNLHSSKNMAVFAVVADSEHALFVEFGTGQMGQEAPYPYPFPPGVDWEYNTGPTIREISPGQYGWFYQRDGRWYFTQGMPARPYMYETFIELKMLVEQTAREVFKA